MQLSTEATSTGAHPGNFQNSPNLLRDTMGCDSGTHMDIKLWLRNFEWIVCEIWVLV